MAYIPGYTYDIFISYAHVDNVPTSWENMGWIEKFYKDLDTLLTRRIGKPDIKIWWDNRKLDGSILFDKSIEDGINRSAIIICLNSPSYLSSVYCQKELVSFYAKAKDEVLGLKVLNRSRLLNVLLYNIPHTEWPEELKGTTGFSFHDAKEADDTGDPLDTSTIEFRNKLQDLRDALIKLINDFPKAIDPPVPEEKESFTIYMGEVADTLRATRKRTILDLEKKGYKIIQGIPPPYEAPEHEQKIKEAVKKVDLSVHLLDQYPGKEIPGSQDTYPQKQAELGMQFAKSQLVWVPAELDHSIIEEDNYKSFLQSLEEGKQPAKSYEYIRGSKSTLTQELSEFAEQVKLLQQQKQAPKGKISVLLDTHFNDQIYALDLSRILLENQIQPFINPQEDDPRKNINMLSDRISQVTNLVFFYGQVSRDWVMERMSAALQLIITNNYPVEDFYIYMAGPNKDPNEISLKQRFLKVYVINNSLQLLNKLKGGTT